MADDRDRPLVAADLAADPIVQLRRWLEEARAAGSDVADVMTLATSTLAGVPSARMVLLKEVDGAGLSFYSSYESRKGRELAENPAAAVVLYWNELGRQVRAEGRVERLPAEDSDTYFRSRPFGSRLSAAVSHQSQVIESREQLERAAEALAGEGEEVPRPEHWGGYRLVPEEWEFWQHRVDRLHDRFRYRPGADGLWIVERLAP